MHKIVLNSNWTLYEDREICCTGAKGYNCSVVELHRMLNDRPSAISILDATHETASYRSADDVIDLLGKYYITPETAAFLYGGSICSETSSYYCLKLIGVKAVLPNDYKEIVNAGISVNLGQSFSIGHKKMYVYDEIELPRRSNSQGVIAEFLVQVPTVGIYSGQELLGNLPQSEVSKLRTYTVSSHRYNTVRTNSKGDVRYVKSEFTGTLHAGINIAPIII